MNTENLVDVWLFGMRFNTGYPNENNEALVNHSFQVIKKMNPQEILPRLPVIPGHTDSNRYLEQCCRLLEAHDQHEVFLNPWNKNFNHYYEACGISPMLETVTPEAAERSEEKIYRYFISEGIMPVGSRLLGEGNESADKK